MPALVALAATLSLLAATAFAFTLENTGFSATTYASGYPLDTAGRGARGTAWDGNLLWAVDASDSGLYRADAGGMPTAATSLTATPVATIAGGVAGLAVGLDGRLYATLVATHVVVEIDKTTYATRTVADNPLISPRDVATDPLSGDLIVTGATKIWRVSAPASASPVTTIYAALPGSAGSGPITIGPDGTIFVVNDFGQLFVIESTAVATTHTGPAMASPMGSPVAGMTGLGVVTNGIDTVPQFLMVSTSGGAVYKTPATSGASGNTILVLDRAGTGDQLSIGPDRCAYASLSGAVLRVADVGGGCQLNTAGITPPALTITDTTGQPERVNGIATVSAHLTNASVLSGHVIALQVTSATAPTLAFTATTDSSGNASVTYTRAATGTDTVAATTSADGFAVTSNTLSIVWQPQPDFSPPLISFDYTVASAGRGTTFSCDTTQTSASFAAGVSPEVPCGWFTKAPTVHFTIAATGISGLGTVTNCGDYTLNTQPPAAGQPVTCRAYNGDGLASSTLTVVINAVLSPPSIAATATANASPYAAGALTRGPVIVHFDCSASPIQTGLVCPVDQTFSGTGLYDAAGTATDVAGQTTTVHFAPIDIDATPPTITVTPIGYAYGSWTNADVHLLFTCADNVAVVSCPGDVAVTASTPGFTGTATDAAGNMASVTSAAINIDRTPPTIAASATRSDGTAYLAGTPTNQNVTVHFTCATDAAPVTVCGPDVTYTVEGTTMTTSGTASDAAGNSATASFGVVVIDRTPSTITPVVTVNGLAYDGSWTRGPVLVHFVCADDTQLASCSGDRTLTADQNATVSGTAVDAAGNISTTTTVPILIDRTPPVTTVTLTGTVAGSATYLFTVNVALGSTDAGSGAAAIHYTVDGVPHDVVGATTSFVVDTEGPHTVAFHATDAVGNVELEQTTTFTVINRQHTTLTITSTRFLATGAPVTARLLNIDAGTPIAGETVTFAAGAVTRTALTDVAGIARVDLVLAPGAYALTATYAGTPRYFPSAGAQDVVVYAPTRFVVWGPNAIVGSAVQFYGDDWAKQITDARARRVFEDFKGYAQAAFDAYWTGRPGDTVTPPRTIPEYVGVIVTTHGTKTKGQITGDRVSVAILKIVPRGDDGHGDSRAKPYDGRLGERAVGTVLAIVD